MTLLELMEQYEIVPCRTQNGICFLSNKLGTFLNIQNSFIGDRSEYEVFAQALMEAVSYEVRNNSMRDNVADWMKDSGIKERGEAEKSYEALWKWAGRLMGFLGPAYDEFIRAEIE